MNPFQIWKPEYKILQANLVLYSTLQGYRKNGRTQISTISTIFQSSGARDVNRSGLKQNDSVSKSRLVLSRMDPSPNPDLMHILYVGLPIKNRESPICWIRSIINEK